MPRPDLLDGLTEAQRRAVLSDAAPLCILAGAGSGKTRVLTRRIAHRILTGTAAPQHVLALTFTRKAAGELRARLGALGIRDQVAAGTFHSLAYASLRQWWADRGERPPALLEGKARLLVPLVRRVEPRTGRRDVPVAEVAAEIEWARARMVAPAGYEAAATAAGRTPPLPPALVAEVYDAYERDKRKRRVLDFDDLLVRCVQALEADAGFAAAQRWRHQHLFVDEFQDVNPVQHRLLRAWLGDRLDLCVVGDPNQAIYSWNGADPRFLTGFAEQFPSAEIVRLDDNFRSSPQILAVAHAVLGPPAGRHRLRPHQPDGPVPTVRSYPTDEAEARGVARALRLRHAPGTTWSRLAVLVRTNAQAALIEEALGAAGIPFRSRGGGFLHQPEVRDLLDRMRRWRVPFPTAVADLQVLAADTVDDDHRASVEALVRLAAEHAALDPSPTVEGFMAWLAATLRADDGGDGRRDAVEIATFHRAKGLEWPVVFVAGLEQGFVPISRATTPEAEAEERRLLYVALTRAESELHCSWAEQRTFGTRAVRRSPSPWLEAIERTVDGLEGGPVARRIPPDIKQQLARLAAGPEQQR